MTTEESQEKLIELIKSERVCMLTTVDENGDFCARPMGMQEVEFDGDLWFFTYANSRKVFHIMNDPKVGVSISNQKDSSWVSISGEAEVVDDMQKKEELWNPVLKAWFPDGLETPELTLIHVVATGAEFWDSPSSKIATMFSMAKGVITGKPADPGDNEQVEL